MNFSLTYIQQIVLFIFSLILVAFGQPAWAWWSGLLAAGVGFALFWRLLLAVPETQKRFWMSAGWYAGVQVIQLSWMVSHPYLYAYGLLFFCAWALGLQFGIIGLFIRPLLFQNLIWLTGLAALWTLLEWSRLFFLSGFSWNPVGLSLTGALYPLQMATLGGVYLLSFWVMWVNLLALRTWIVGLNLKRAFLWGIAALFPYLFGFFHFQAHEREMAKSKDTVSVLLIQPAFPIEETMHFVSAEEARNFVINEWRQIWSLAKKALNQKVDLVAMPEYVVPYGTYYAVFPFEQVKKVFEDIFGLEYFKALPPLEEPYASYILTDKGLRWLVSNAFFVQTLANLFQADVVAGLEDVEQVDVHKSESYSAAFHFPPNNGQAFRYEKRVLVPMGEYLPFEFCRTIAAQYGIHGSFTPGKEAKVFKGCVPFGISICYEETYGHLIRENRLQGAQLLVNITNDGWYPNSYLPQQHFDHGRLRAIENGVPVVRSCNTGITGAIDSLGRVHTTLGKNLIELQNTADALLVEVPAYHYQTVYAKFGDRLIIGFCMIALFMSGFHWILTRQKE
jgi:apolipoprotein N-acyltransferase